MREGAGGEAVRAEDQGVSDLLTPAEVAALFNVNPKTVTRWATEGRIRYTRTLGGHRRYPRSEVDRLLKYQ